ncbi:MAG: hypothetical protein ACRDLV_11060 [Solirubrobacteraceae bacterium]
MHPQLSMIMVNSRIDDLRTEGLRAQAGRQRQARRRRLSALRRPRWWSRRGAGGGRGKGGPAFA